MILNLKADKLDVEYDSEADAVYITVKPGKVAKTQRLATSVMIDLDSKGHLLGVEIIDASLGSASQRGALRLVSKRFHMPHLQQFHPEQLPKLFVA